MFFARPVACFLALAASFLFAAGSAAHESTEGTRSVVVARVAHGPVLKGDLSDPAWRRGALLSDFHSVEESETLIQPTEARVLYDSKYMYIGVKCSEARMGELAAAARGRDTGVWSDDVVELFIDTTNSHSMYYHIGVNSIGTIADQRCRTGRGWDSRWNPDCRLMTGRSADGWTLEIAIPFSGMGVVPAKGLAWGFNICRNRTPVVKEASAWSPSPQGFEIPASFGHVLLGDEAGRWDGVQLRTWGNLDTGVSEGRDSAVCAIPNAGSAAARYRISLSRGGERTIWKNAVVQPGETGVVEIPYRTAGVEGQEWSLVVTKGRHTLLRARHPSAAGPSEDRVWQVSNPLYRELLSDTPPGLQQGGAIYWINTYIPSLLPDFAKEYGLRYSNDEAIREMADNKLLPLMTTQMIEDPFFLKTADKYALKALFYPDIRHWKSADVPVVDGCSYMLDPGSRRRYFDDLEAALGNWRRYIRGIYTSDEMSEYALMHTLNTYWKFRDSYPYIREVNERVKEDYGFGKYGIPESADDENPYRWIAVRRWVNQEIADWQKGVYDTVRATAPEIMVISIDPVCGHKPVGWDMMAPYIDIATQQIYPPMNPDRQQFGFTTKMVADLTGKPTWPCTHVEHYPFSTTVEEVRELMSQVMRSGGKGFHFWLKDEIGNNAPNGFMMSTRWGFPERWRAIMEINRLNSSMNEVAVPDDPDFAILYSEDHYQSFSEKAASFPYFFTNEPEWAYTFFGPVAGGWFSFVNDNMIAGGRTNLSRFKAVIVPAAKYERGAVAAALADYVKSGGTLVVADPEAFSWDISGEPLTPVRTELVGSAPRGADQKSMKFDAGCSMKSLRGRALGLTSSSFKITPPEGAEVMARFEDTTPAVFRHTVGKGSVLVFACNPFTESGISDAKWKSFFRAFTSELGLKTGRGIWRFEFPPLQTVEQALPDGTCLTGNYIKWWQDRPMDVRNADVTGTYSFSTAPDAIPDRGETAVPFVSGKLTDREKAFTTLKTQLKAEDFVVSWKTPGAVDVDFDLAEPRQVSRLNLWYSGQLPAFTVRGSADGRTWIDLASHAGSPPDADPRDVLDVSLSLGERRVRFLRLSFAERAPGAEMTLVECEIWGRERL